VCIFDSAEDDGIILEEKPFVKLQIISLGKKLEKQVEILAETL
jgi:hypothetical protein